MTVQCHKCCGSGHDTNHCPVDRRDLEAISPIAAFIAARLNYVLPPCNSGVRGNKLVSTIAIDQHKEKFWFVRIYCTLADPELVKQKWLQSGHADEPTPEYTKQCLKHDAWHYRRCYTDMLSLLPERLHNRVRSQADYSELLYDNARQLKAFIHEEEAEGDKSNQLHFLRGRYGTADNEGLLAQLAEYYNEPGFRGGLDCGG